jgi:hypothetical protein
MVLHYYLCKHNDYNSKWSPGMTCFNLYSLFSGYFKTYWVVSTFVGYFEVFLKYVEVFGCLFYLHDSVGDVVCVLDYVTGSVGVFPGLSFILVLCDYCV